MRRLLAAALVAGSVGCAEVRPARPPEIAGAAAFKEAPAAADAGTPLPADWWTWYGDSELDQLQRRLLDNSPDLASALALYQQARAATGALRAEQSPAVGAAYSAQRQRQSDQRPLRGATSPEYYNSGALGVDLLYEVDLWGRVRQRVDAGLALERAAGADLAAARLSLRAQLADAMLTLRGIDREAVLLDDTLVVYERAVALVARRHDGGLSSGLDLARAQTQLEATRSQARQVQARRAVLEHAIAALVGADASSFSIAPRALAPTAPAIPPGVPSALLRRRPDIAAARFRVAAAGARVGVARTAFFPSLTLGAQAGFQSGELDKLVRMPNLFWAVGPALALDLLDGGRRQANVDGAEAALDEAGQRYRAVVLAAFQQVEDQLAQLNHYGAAAEADLRAAEAAQRGVDLATIRYRQGAASYLEVVTAQTANLTAQRSALDLGTRQRRAGVQLVRALGGGWSGDGALE
jgi:NodT family efflux transporter outer membrane factor (OMF) lipoprotein